MVTILKYYFCFCCILSWRWRCAVACPLTKWRTSSSGATTPPPSTPMSTTLRSTSREPRRKPTKPSRTMPGSEETSSLWVIDSMPNITNRQKLCSNVKPSPSCRQCSSVVLLSSRPGSCPVPCLPPRPSVTTWGTSGLAPRRSVWIQRLMPALFYFIFLVFDNNKNPDGQKGKSSSLDL